MAPLALLVLALAAAASAQHCTGVTAPPPAPTFQLAAFFGSWYEIARIQTEGGNLVQQFCACTELIYTPTNANRTGGNASDTTVNNSCRFKSSKGFWLNATSYLTDGGSAGGHWQESYFKGGSPASYNAIIAGTDARGVDYYVEFDCSGKEYCLHFLSRRPTGFDPALLAALVHNTTVTMDLNPQHRVLNMTMQEDGCWA